MSTEPLCPYLAEIQQWFAHLPAYFVDDYIAYTVGGKTVLLHREVAKLAYGEIPPGYHVHHKDENKRNNRADNLEILSPAEHRRRHHPRLTVTCAQCREQFPITRSQFDTSEIHYCSRPCKALAERKVERPSKDKLSELLSDLRNFCAIGRMYNVSDNTVRNWARSYSLDLSICDGRKY